MFKKGAALVAALLVAAYLVNSESAQANQDNIVLRLYHSSGWGSGFGQQQRSLRVLTTGEVQCYTTSFGGWNFPHCADWQTATPDCEAIWNDNVMVTLETLSAEQTATLQSQLAGLRGLPEINTGSTICFDGLVRYYDTGNFVDPDFGFWQQEAVADCGAEGIDSPVTQQLVRRMNEWFSRCPLIEGAGSAFCFPGDHTCL